MPTLMRMFKFIAANLCCHLFDFATTGRAFVQATFGTQRRSRLAAFLAEGNFAALTTEDHIPPAVNRRAAAQNRAFMQTADGACGGTLFAALFASLLFATQTAQRDLGIRVMSMGHTDLLLPATRKSQQCCGQARQ
jgi:hypothetical protein